MDELHRGFLLRRLMEAPANGTAPAPADEEDSGDPLWKNGWLWAGVAGILLCIIVLVALLVIKQCLCESKRKLKYTPIDVERYGSHTPVTDKHRADMEAKYGRLSKDY